MPHPLRVAKLRGGVLIAVLIAASLVFAAAASAAVVRPTVTVVNDANHDGTFTGSETVPKNAHYPWSVPYKVTIDTTGTPIGALVFSLTDDVNATIGTCAALIGTTIPTNASATCAYTASLAAAGASPLVNTVTLGYNRLGLDIVTGSSTVNFEPQKAAKSKCNSGNGNGSDAISWDPESHCYGGDPGNSYNAGNKGGDEIPTSGGVPNPGGNNVP
jgi:hypothetical protein